MSSLPIPPLHTDFAFRVEYVGAEQEPVLIIDQLVAAPELLVDWAELRGNFIKADAYYPGVRAKAPALYAQFIAARLGDLMVKYFDMNKAKPIKADCQFSIVSTPAHELLAGQSIPHFDSLNRFELAAVHYLCPADKGGTSLYRHLETGFESVSDERINRYRNIAYAEAEHVKGQFINGDNAYYQRTASYDAVFNRLILYRCTSLHSGNITADFVPDLNPRSGRLTLNSFIYQ